MMKSIVKAGVQTDLIYSDLKQYYMKMLVVIFFCTPLLYTDLESASYAQPYAEAFDQMAYPAHIQQKFFPRSKAYLTFHRVSTDQHAQKLARRLPQALSIPKQTHHTLYAIYHMHVKNVPTTQTQQAKQTQTKQATQGKQESEARIQPLGWIYQHHHQTSQGVLRVFWAFDQQFKIKGYQVSRCLLHQCHLLNNEQLIGFLQGKTLPVLKSYLSSTADHLVNALPHLPLTHQNLGLALLHSAMISLIQLDVLWPNMVHRFASTPISSTSRLR